MAEPYGATPQEWDHFSLMLGLTSDLLPVVSNPNATISPDSKMRSLGKTPSRYNSRGQVAGIANWTQKQATSAEVTAWRAVPDLGICIQTRHVRALDVDIPDNQIFADNVHDEINNTLGATLLPTRRRSDSSKFLCAFTLDGDYSKRVIRTDAGIIEFLATGQQFIAAGQHQDGARYEWRDGLPEDIPVLDAATFERLWARLTECFASDGTADVAAPTIRHNKIHEAIKNDPIAQSLYDSGIAVGTERDGRVHITCPFEAEHTSGGDASATTYFPASTGGFARGHFACLHAHCANRTDADFLNALGLSTGATNDDFPVVPQIGVDRTQLIAPQSDGAQDEIAPQPGYAFKPWDEFVNATPPTFHVRGVIPQAALTVIYGASQAGKTFLVLDLALAVARGVPWRGLRVRQGTVAYIAAEDAAGVAMRCKAYEIKHGLKSLPLHLLAAAPNFRDFEDMTNVARAVVKLGAVSLIIVDTWARVLSGDENSAQDVTEALNMCAKLYRATGASVVLIHHSGKDSAKGARGSTALLAGCDAEIEVTRFEDDHEAQVTKLKNFKKGERYGFKLEVVPVGLDDNQDVVSSCVIEHVETHPRVDRKALEPKGVNEKLVLRALDDLSIGGAVVTAEVIDAAVNHMPFDSASGKRDQRRKSAVVALNALIERGILAVEGNEIQRKGEQ